MTDTVKEQLSAFLDGELPEAETTLLLKRLDRDDDLKGTLSRYSLIGAVMRSDDDMPAARNVAARVSAALLREPSLGAAARYRWARPAAGLAVAASVALATVLLLPQWFGTANVDDVTATVAMTPQELPEAGAAVVPVVMAAVDDEPAITYTTPPAPTEPAGKLPSAQLAAYLVAHSEYTLPLSRRSVVATLPEEPSGQAATDAAQAGN
jgi:sigma-E factor negative regulatory protein RseA